jgi:hypothetical protein
MWMTVNMKVNPLETGGKCQKFRNSVIYDFEVSVQFIDII